MASFSLCFYLFSVARLGVDGFWLCSHHSLVTQLVCAAQSEGSSEDWILDHSFTYHYRDLRMWKTLIMVFSLML